MRSLGSAQDPCFSLPAVDCVRWPAAVAWWRGPFQIFHPAEIARATTKVYLGTSSCAHAYTCVRWVNETSTPRTTSNACLRLAAAEGIDTRRVLFSGVHRPSYLEVLGPHRGGARRERRRTSGYGMASQYCRVRDDGECFAHLVIRFKQSRGSIVTCPVILSLAKAERLLPALASRELLVPGTDATPYTRLAAHR